MIGKVGKYRYNPKSRKMEIKVVEEDIEQVTIPEEKPVENPEEKLNKVYDFIDQISKAKTAEDIISSAKNIIKVKEEKGE